MKKALVTGVGGQDGFYMSELLLEQGYETLGIVHSLKPNACFDNRMTIIPLNIRDYNAVYELVKREKPDEIYNFAAQSSSIYSWDNTRETCELNFMVPVAILESIKDNDLKSRFFQASSAEIFGKDPSEMPQSEKTIIHPATPYATAKSATGMIIENYREHYGVYAVNGILYNHESVRRKESFLPAKISRTVADIKLGLVECLYVGNINSKRDWGYAPDYMEAIWNVMQLEKPDDYIFATGVLHSVREMIELSFKSVGLPILWRGSGKDEVGITDSTGKVVVRIDERFYRDYDRNNSLGNPDKLFKTIDWRPKTSFEEMISYMTNYFVEKREKNV